MDKSSRARTLRLHSTAAERLLWAQLRDRRIGGFKFRRQRPIGPYVVDFVCLEHKLIVELDGAPHELTMEYDAARDARLRTEGYVVLRFRNDEVRGNLDGVRQAISNALGAMEEPSP
ncbi:MAG: endonuclease domain-containing protein [Alphaproteobacteria bacterium]|nr:endonuclease domain-containing protein [Alphaproteobacteria bacterium]